MPLRNDGYVLRSDLSLRSRYPYIQTRIFSFGSFQYVIYFPLEMEDADRIQKIFSDEMRIITCNVSLTNKLPAQYHEELAPISDREIALDFKGLPLTRSDIIETIAMKFPEIDLGGLGEPEAGTVTIILRTDPPAELRNDLKRFLDGIETANFNIEVNARSELKNDPNDDVLHIPPLKFRARSATFTRSDEGYWFDNVDSIYARRLRPQRDFSPEEVGTVCLIDYSTGREFINLRQALMTYDTVLAVPPVFESKEGWDAQGLSQADIESAVVAGRLKFVLTQNEDRLDVPLLERAFEIDPSCVIGRRRSASVILGDLVETSEEYKLNPESAAAALKPLSELLSQEMALPADDVLELMAWPITTLRDSFRPLTDRGSFGMIPLGQGPILAKHLKRLTGKDRDFEVTMLSEQVHLAHAFNATIIPALDMPTSWHQVHRTIGDRLNFYRSFNTRIAAAWVGNEQRREQKRPILAPVPVFEFDREIPLREILEATTLASTRRKGRALISRLADLPSEEERQEYLRTLSRRWRHGGREPGVLSLENLEDLGPLTDIVVGHAAPPFFAMRNVLKRVLTLRNRSPTLDRILESIAIDIDNTLGRNGDLDFLSKVDRVAVLKRPRVG